MARVTLSSIVSSISGSIGSSTFRNSPTGTVLYNRPMPSQRSSPAQQFNRSILRSAASAWYNLDADIKQSWSTLARQENIPTFFARGKKWTGKQLFTCFFFYAEHQFTPLPARWLPTPPIFQPTLVLFAQFFDPNSEYPPIDPPQETDFHCMVPDVLNPVFPDDYSTDCVFSLWMSIVPKDSRNIPRNTVKLCPAPADYPIINYSGNPLKSGYQYTFWEPVIFLMTGIPPGLTENPTAWTVAPFDVYYSGVCLTDQRLYFTGDLWGTPHTYAGTNHYIRYGPTGEPCVVTNSVWPPNIPTTTF